MMVWMNCLILYLNTDLLQNKLRSFINNNEVITMPQGDGTGPDGNGPKTGRGNGSCN